jgi:hypothetical protein
MIGARAFLPGGVREGGPGASSLIKPSLTYHREGKGGTSSLLPTRSAGIGTQFAWYRIDKNFSVYVME